MVMLPLRSRLTHLGSMSFAGSRFAVALLGAVFYVAAVAPTPAQTNGEQKTQEQGQKAPAAPATGDAAKEEKEKKKMDEFAEAARALDGPAGNAECVWFGRRAIARLWSDDLDTAFRHLEMYDRFGCPDDRVQQAFRCVIRQGNIDAKSADSLNARVHACWINPSLPPAIAAPPPSTAAGAPNQETH
jgi:hypothetical protein